MNATTLSDIEILQNIGLDNSRLFCKHGTIRMGWCEHLQQAIERGLDAPMIYPGVRIEVPVFPTSGVYADVVIKNENVLGNGAAKMFLDFTPDVGRPYTVKLGYWNPGEGTGSIRAVILDYMRSKLEPNESFLDGAAIVTPCPAGPAVHSIRNSRIVAEQSRSHLQWKLECLWNMVMEKACTPCLNESNGADPLAGLGSL